MIDAIIPARNEEATIGPIVDTLVKHPGIGNVIVVVDADTTDQTADIAVTHGALVVYGKNNGVNGVRGKGQCIGLGLVYSQSSYVFLCDADLMHLTAEHVTQMTTAERFTIGIPDFPLQEILATPLVQDSPAWFNNICATWGLVSGERIAEARILRSIDLHGYLTEVQITNAYRAKGIAPMFVSLRGLYSPFVMMDTRIAEMQRDRTWGIAHGVFGKGINKT